MGRDLLVKNGLIVNATGSFKGDVLVRDGVIARLGLDLTEPGVPVLDAEGKLVFPGIVDPHVQLEIKYGAFPMTDDFDTGTVAAAAGGVTTIIDFADQPKGVPALTDLKNRRALADGRVNVDYSLHMSITDLSVGAVSQIGEIIASGIPSFKCYMAYSRRDRMVNEGQMHAIMTEVARHGGIVGIHGENDNLVEFLITQHKKEGRTAVKYFTEARPVLGEEIAVRTAILLAEKTGCELYVHHVSCARTIEAIVGARARGVRVFAETCPPYLTLTEDVYRLPGGERFILNPALRTAADRRRLWEAIIRGEIDTIGTDHCSYKLEQKQRNKDDFDAIPAGLPGIELLLPVMYSEGVAKGRISANRLIELLSLNPARIFGLHPRKGSIMPGADGDLVIFDPRREWIVRPEDLQMNVDFTPFDGEKLSGAVETTVLRGQVLWQSGKFVGPRHLGEFVRGMADTRRDV